MRPEEEHTTYVVPVDYLLHTPGNPFCPVDPSCPCHVDRENIAQVASFVQEGLMTPEEATDFVNGRMI